MSTSSIHDEHDPSSSCRYTDDITATTAATTMFCCLPPDVMTSSQQGDALDVIVVRPSPSSCRTDNSSNSSTPSSSILRQQIPSCSDFTVQFPSSSFPCSSVVKQQERQLTVQVWIGGTRMPDMDMEYYNNSNEKDDDNKKECRFRHCNSTKPSTETLSNLLQKLFLLRKNNDDNNNNEEEVYTIRYVLLQQQQQIVLSVATANLFVWNATDRIVVCDIDGTITKSNARGVFDSIFLQAYVHVHDGVCAFFQRLVQEYKCYNNTLRMLYLTSRPLNFARTTRKFLSQLTQQEDKLPVGPLFMHSKHLGHVLLSELIKQDMHLFKSDILIRNVILPFRQARRRCTHNHEHTTSNDDDDDDMLVVAAAFGNSYTDVLAYEMAGIPRRDIYTIDKASRVYGFDTNGNDSASQRHQPNRRQVETDIIELTRSEGQIQKNKKGGEEVSMLPLSTSHSYSSLLQPRNTTTTTPTTIHHVVSENWWPSESFFNKGATTTTIFLLGYQDPALYDNVMRALQQSQHGNDDAFVKPTAVGNAATTLMRASTI